MRIPNRSATWTDEGVGCEGDLRHVEIGLEELGLTEWSRSASTPVEKETIIERQGAGNQVEKKQGRTEACGKIQLLGAGSSQISHIL